MITAMMVGLLAPAMLRCEYQIDPLGIGEREPRLSWEVRDERPNASQSAYRLRVALDPEAFATGSGISDTGKVPGSQSIHVPYRPEAFTPRGPDLVSRTRIYWQVQTFDQDGNPSPWSETAWFEAGLLEPSDWEAEWIGANWQGGPRTPSPAPFLRREFNLSAKPVRARLYITALGIFHAEINGQEAHPDDELAPGWTNYAKRVYAMTYDVTDLLDEGPNAIGVALGDGWYAGHVAGNDRQNYGDQPRLKARLEVECADGATRVVVTDEEWAVASGPILEGDLIMGEAYDARQELVDWSMPGADDDRWTQAVEFADPGVVVEPHPAGAIKRQEELIPISGPKDMGGRLIYDMGQNMVGWVRLKVTGTPGTTVRLRFAEMLDDKGELYTVSLRGARATDYYTLKGGGEEVWEPRFTFHGFRYVELSLPGWNLRSNEWKVDKDSVVGVVLNSEIPRTGDFECSNPLVNQLQHNIVWGQKGNFLDVPTDCPQRDERLGWTGDAQVFVATAAFNADVAGFFTKWQQDLADEQFDNGAIPCVAPNPRTTGTDGGAAWSDAKVICPWTIYQAYGDTRLLERHYDAMKKWVDYLHVEAKDGVRGHPGSPFTGFGDWLSINAETSKELIGTAFLAYSTRLFSQIAAVLGRADDAQSYAAKAEEVRQGWVHRFVTPGGRVSNESQTAYLLALQFELVPPELRPTITDALVADVKARWNHISAGFVGSSYMNPMLSREGRSDVAYDLLNQKTWPSWLFPVTVGATTIWERWDGWTPDKGFQDPGMNSFNHYAYGAIGNWLYTWVAGLSALEPAYKRILIRPIPGGDLTHARGTLRTMYGLAESKWRIEDGSFLLDVIVPANTSAKVVVPYPGATSEGLTPVAGAPGTTVFEVGSGRWSFVARVD